MDPLTPQQRAHLDGFLERYAARTRRSKEAAQASRRVLADSMAVRGFTPTLKEIFYRLTATRAEGSRLWDLDGNEYVDFSMGFGLNLFGHNPGFVRDAVAAQLDKGLPLGPQTELAGEVAAGIARLTGVERVAFCNSGTEAVMTALRIARAVTGRSGTALFSGSYHGHADGTLVAPDGAPLAPGVLAATVAEVSVLPYGADEALEQIALRGDQLAAVLVEPVQGGNPGLQPASFLARLRQLTEERGIALIFDEMITGFRVHPGGAQACFGVAADLALYGKILGGGLPIGVVAGKARFMDSLDGGFWSYGDGSAPCSDRTFLAGTFSRHPLAMAAARAVLLRLERAGPGLQEALNRRTELLVHALDAVLAEEGLPWRFARFGSFFALAAEETSLALELLPYQLIHRGILGRGVGGFLSTAHGEDDLGALVVGLREGVRELRDGGFL
jgi:glutamate-1-semialdehyde aminotransferase